MRSSPTWWRRATRRGSPAGGPSPRSPGEVREPPRRFPRKWRGQESPSPRRRPGPMNTGRANPGELSGARRSVWIPAFAGMTARSDCRVEFRPADLWTISAIILRCFAQRSLEGGSSGRKPPGATSKGCPLDSPSRPGFAGHLRMMVEGCRGGAAAERPSPRIRFTSPVGAMRRHRVRA